MILFRQGLSTTISSRGTSHENTSRVLMSPTRRCITRLGRCSRRSPHISDFPRVKFTRIMREHGHPRLLVLFAPCTRSCDRLVAATNHNYKLARGRPAVSGSFGHCNLQPSGTETESSISPPLRCRGPLRDGVCATPITLDISQCKTRCTNNVVDGELRHYREVSRPTTHHNEIFFKPPDILYRSSTTSQTFPEL